MRNASDFIIENGVLAKYTGMEKEVIIPEGITEIGASAFYENVKVERITLPEGVNVIGNSAFELCRKLESINLPKSLTQIGNQAFRLCRKLKSIEIPGTCASTGSMSFFGCSDLETVVLGEGIREIGGYSFVNCGSLKQINWPESLETISDAAFNSCASMTEIVLPDGIKTIETSAFGDCRSVNRLVLSQAVMDTIDAKWFRSRFNNVDLNYLWLSGRTNFDKRVGELCTKSILRKKDAYAALIIRQNDASAMAKFITLQKKMDIDTLDRYIAESTEVGATTVSAVLLEYKNNQYSSAEVEQAQEIKTEKELGFKEYTAADWRKIFKFSTSDGFTIITGFKGNLQSVTIPAKIGKNKVTMVSLAYNSKGRITSDSELREKITEIIIEPGIVEIEQYAFLDCQSLETLTIPEGVEAIGYGAIWRCGSLVELRIPASVSKISPSAISRCPKLTIHAPAGSYAETWAKEHNIPFVAE